MIPPKSLFRRGKRASTEEKAGNLLNQCADDASLLDRAALVSAPCSARIRRASISRPPRCILRHTHQLPITICRASSDLPWPGLAYCSAEEMPFFFSRSVRFLREAGRPEVPGSRVLQVRAGISRGVIFRRVMEMIEMGL